MTKNIITIICFHLVVCVAVAQPKFILKGKVEYEKKVNMHKIMGEGMWANEMRAKMPQFRVTYFDLLFNGNTSLYQTGREVEDKYRNMWGNMAAGITYSDFNAGTTTQQKDVFEKTYLLQDSLLHVEWKISNETRKIAGFECRKAVGKFMDSLYVIAFYTDEIVIPAGPESINGLPGLILGLAFPRMHATWFATKLELQDIQPKDMAVPAKGKKANRREIISTVKGAIKDWGDEADKVLLQIVM